MVRRMETADLNAVAAIWLDTNLKAHAFIPSQYWKRNYEAVKGMLENAEVYVWEDGKGIQGFVGLDRDYIAGIFVRDGEQSRGIGRELLDFAKGLRSVLSLNVYQKNSRAVRFYRGEGFEILFSYPEGGPASLVSEGREWLWQAPRPAYWRAPTENDLGNGFALKSSVWAAADSWQKCENIEILEESPERVSIRFTYTAPAMPGLKTDVTYTVEDSGCVTAAVHYHGGAGRPGLPLLGLRFATPEPVEEVEWLGLSGETYPDRKKGGVFGWHREVPHVSAYLVPQECGCHVDTRAAVLRNGLSRLTLEMADRPFAFSAIPYTPQQLEQAAHVEELPFPVRTVVTICGAMRGVGGIDSWISDVEEAYHVSGEADQKFSFRLWL